MSFKKMLISAATAAAITSTAFAAGANGDATPIHNDGTGDYLVFPTYWAKADGNWKTNLKVVNTNTTHAVIAKVVVREWATSQEDLDFLIYLTPGDVWEGELVNEGGFARLKSSDDSIFKGDTPASAANPVNQILFDNGPKGNNYGYVEVYGVAQIAAANVTILQGHPAWGGPGTPLDKQSLQQDFVNNVEGQGVGAGAAHGWTEVDNESIYGQQVISSDNQGSEKSMAMVATAFGNFTGTGANGQVVRGVATSIQNATTRTDYAQLVTGIESVLAKREVYVTYYNSDAANTVLQLTQPMKHVDVFNTYTANGDFWTYTPSQDPSSVKSETAARADKDRHIAFGFTYTVTTRDQMEHSVKSDDDFSGGKPVTYNCYEEICYFTPLANQNPNGYESGYFTYNFKNEYEAIPAIPTIMTAVKVNGTPVTNIIYATYAEANNPQGQN